MKFLKLVFSLLLFTLLSCKGGGDGGAASESPIPNQQGSGPTVISSNVTLNKVRQKELNQINQELNIQYQLSEEELSSLVEEGALSNEEKKELSSLLN